MTQTQQQRARPLFLLAILLALVPATALVVLIAIVNVERVGWSEGTQWSVAAVLSAISLPYALGVVGGAMLGIRGARRFARLGALALLAGLVLFANLNLVVNSAAIFVGAVLLGAAVSALLPRASPRLARLAARARAERAASPSLIGRMAVPSQAHRQALDPPPVR